MHGKKNCFVMDLDGKIMLDFNQNLLHMDRWVFRYCCFDFISLPFGCFFLLSPPLFILLRGANIKFRIRRAMHSYLFGINIGSFCPVLPLLILFFLLFRLAVAFSLFLCRFCFF